MDPFVLLLRSSPKAGKRSEFNILAQLSSYEDAMAQSGLTVHGRQFQILTPMMIAHSKQLKSQQGKVLGPALRSQPHAMLQD